VFNVARARARQQEQDSNIVSNTAKQQEQNSKSKTARQQDSKTARATYCADIILID